MGKAALQWTDDMLAQLGKEKDAVLAERWGTSAKTVNLKRNALGIAAFGHFQWTKEAVAMLGKEPDAEVARQLGISKASVVAKRVELDISPLDAKRGRSAQHSWTNAEIVQLGTAPDAQVAAQLGLSHAAVRNARMARGIAPARPRKPPISKS